MVLRGVEEGTVDREGEELEERRGGWSRLGRGGAGDVRSA